MTKRCNFLIRQITRSIINNIDDRFVDAYTGANVLAENIVLKNILLCDDIKMKFATNSEILSLIEEIKHNQKDYGINGEVHILDSELFYDSILKCVIQSNKES